MVTIRRKIAEYQNGNVHTILYSDGSKVRTTEDDEFKPAFAESIDINISNKCDNGCPMCYQSCTEDGEFGSLLLKNWINTLHSGTEVAANLNFPLHPDFYEFAETLKRKGVILNVTVNQRHFEEHNDIIQDLCEKRLIKGLGISLVEASVDFVREVRRFPNAVIHVINGIFTKDDYYILRNQNLALLILGYKYMGRGMVFRNENIKEIKELQKWLENNLDEIFKGFDIVCFDNLALDQINVKDKIPNELWDTLYCGDDGEFSFYINTVKDYFAISSTEAYSHNKKNHKIRKDMSVDDMFNEIRGIKVEKDKVIEEQQDESTGWIPVSYHVTGDGKTSPITIVFDNKMPNDGEEVWASTRHGDVYHTKYDIQSTYLGDVPWISIQAWQPYYDPTPAPY